jgi:MinD superfamily P-loop ATPase
MMPSMPNGTKISAQDFRDALLLHNARTPDDLPSNCHGCDVKFCVCHALVCKVGSLITLWYDEINEELCDLVSKALAPSAVRVKPMIQNRHSAEETKAKVTEKPEVLLAQVMKSVETCSFMAFGPT